MDDLSEIIEADLKRVITDVVKKICNERMTQIDCFIEWLENGAKPFKLKKQKIVVKEGEDNEH